MKAKYLLKGIIKNLPGIEFIYQFNKNTGGSGSARYCYSVWLRHLIFAYKNGLTSVPKIIAELGPGDSLGCGIAALISGAEKYYPLDVKIYSNIDENLKIFDELVILFKQKTDVLHDIEFREVRPLLDNYDFPKDIFSDEYLKNILDEKRLANIRNAIEMMNTSESSKKIIEYKVPWYEKTNIHDENIDFIFSQAVLQDVKDLEFTYRRIWQLLKKDGLQSHDIGFKSCGTSDKWFGHWMYSDLEWKIVNGRKKLRINREPYSTHKKLLKKNNFKILYEQKQFAESTINKERLPVRFKSMTDEDLTTYSVFIQAKK